MRYFLFFIISFNYLISSPMDHIFSELDTKDMKTNYLYDKQLHFVDPLNYSGDLQNDKESSWFVFNDLSYQFYSSTISSANDFVDREELEKSENSPYILFSKYDKVKDDAEEMNYFFLEDGVLKDSVGRVNNPYEQKYCFSFAFLNDKILTKSNTGEALILFDPKLIQSNQEIKKYQIDYGEGNGYENISFGDSLIVNFSVLGKREIKFRIEVAGKKYESKTTVEVMEYEGPYIECDNCDVTFIENGDLIYTTWYSGCSQRRTKRPIVFVDGFDPMLNDKDYYGSMNADDFKRLLNVNANGLHDRLLENGYDVVFVDFKYGADKIEKNAALLEKLLDDYNNPRKYNLTSDIRLVGISMGGLISRFCLAQMQEQGKKHNVGLWMTLDSPHQGAYIPWGIRNTIYFNNDYFKKYMPSDALSGLNKSLRSTESDAAKQMLISHESLKMKQNYDNTYDWFMFYSRLSTMPFPDINKTIAFTNGALSGVRQKRYVTPSERFLPNNKYFHHKSELDAWLLFTELEYKVDLNALPEIDYNDPGFYRYSRNEYELNRNILGIGFATIEEKKVSKKILNDIGPSLETIAGGYRRTNVDIEKAFAFLANFGLNPHRDSHTIYQRKDHCFIPLASSLDLRTPSGNLADLSYWNKNIKTALANDELITPFDEVYGLDYYNTPHALAEKIENPIIEEEVFYQLEKLFKNSLVPEFLKLQNDVIDNRNNNYFESKHKINVGEFVDSEKKYGKFIISEDNEVHLKSKNKIQIKEGSYFKAGSFVTAKLEDVFKSCEVKDKITHKEIKTDQNISKIFVYPNPTAEYINIDLTIEDDSNYDLKLYDLTGNLIIDYLRNEEISKGSYKLNYQLPNLQNGTYILVLKSDNINESIKLKVEK